MRIGESWPGARLFGRMAELIWTTSPAACALLLPTMAVSSLAPVALMLFGRPYVCVQSRGAQMAFWAIMTQSPAARRLGYLATLAAQLDAAKGTRLFGLSAYRLQIYRAITETGLFLRTWSSFSTWSSRSG